MATKAQKAAQAILAKKKKEKEVKRLAKEKADKAAAAKEKRDTKKAKEEAIRKSRNASGPDAEGDMVMLAGRIADSLTEISITLNSLLDVVQTGNSTIHGGDEDPTIDGDIDTSGDDDPPEGSAQEQEPDNIDAAHMKQAVRIALAKVGSDKVTKLFKKFEIDRISDLKEEKYPSMLKKLEAL